jgi:hypothetical protein
MSGRELRALDYPFPLWQFTLVFDFLRDNKAAGYDELRTLMGFYMLCQGAFGTFLFNDPTDNQVVGQVITPASSVIGVSISAGGAGYSPNDLLTLIGGGGTLNNGRAATVVVSGVSGGVITGLTIADGGSYNVVPSVFGNISVTGGTGSGAQVTVTWLTVAQLVRTLGGFVEPIVAPNNVSSVYYDGIRQGGVAVNFSTGVLTLTYPFFYSRLASVQFAFSPSLGTGYVVGDVVTAIGGTLSPIGGPTQWSVSAIGASGRISQLTPLNEGSYSVVPGDYITLSGGSGSGANLSVTWTVQPPTITVDFTYYFRCRFIDDSYQFENFLMNLWQLKKLTFISVRP